MDFEIFTMDVPVGSHFVRTHAMPNLGLGGLVSFSNDGKYSKEVSVLQITTMILSYPPPGTSLHRTDGDINIYKNNEGEDKYYIERQIGEYRFVLTGSDMETMVNMLKTIQIKDMDKLASQNSSSAPNSSTQSSTPSSISILGGSFSTGSENSDKTYARINVGTAHAGENVIVQIFYSRDGKSLNNGNMVPATVHSDGYLEIASADAYKYYPDYATIKIYDSNNELLTTQSVSLSPSAGTQTF